MTLVAWFFADLSWIFVGNPEMEIVHFSFPSGEQPDSGSCTPNSAECTISNNLFWSQKTLLTLTQFCLHSYFACIRWIAALALVTRRRDYPDTGFRMFLSIRYQYTLNAGNGEQNRTTTLGESLSTPDGSIPFQSLRIRPYHPLDDPDVTVNPPEQCPPGTIDPVVGSNAAIFEHKHTHRCTH